MSYFLPVAAILAGWFVGLALLTLPLSFRELRFLPAWVERERDAHLVDFSHDDHWPTRRKQEIEL